jgi:hypothetical protein
MKLTLDTTDDFADLLKCLFSDDRDMQKIQRQLNVIIRLLEGLQPPPIEDIIKIRISARFGGMLINFNLGETDFMWTIPGTTPDTAFSLAVSGAKDAEGSTVPGFDPSLYAIAPPTSDNEGAVSFPSYDPATNSGIAHFGTPNTDGSPNIANLRADVSKVEDGSPAGALVATVNVTAGEAVSLVGGFTFEGLTEDPA